MLKAPRVFISSTIYDFRDLRSALKYWFNNMGYNVQLSEFHDFEKNIELNSYEACLNVIDKCDYFILLIGSRVGGLYRNGKDKKISITQQEYRHALELYHNGVIKKIIVFVRQDVWDKKDDINEMRAYIKNLEELSSDFLKLANMPSKRMSDPEFIVSFIEEVGKTKRLCPKLC